MKSVLAVFSILFLSICAFAQIEPIPDVDPLAKLLELILNFKTMSPLAIGMVVIVIGTQLLKKLLPAWPYNRLTVAILSSLYGIVFAFSQGITWSNALVMVLITGGGAIAIYEAWKGLSGGVLESK